MSSDNEISKINPYYHPDLFQLILDQIYLMPFWTSLMLNRCQSKYRFHNKFTRLTNNPVENWFKILKHNILLKKKVNPSELSIAIYKYINGKVNKYHSSLLIQKNSKENETFLNNKSIVEKWKPKKKDTKRQKGIYYVNISDFGNIEGEEKELFRQEDFNDAFEISDAVTTSFHKTDVPTANQESNSLNKGFFF